MVNEYVYLWNIWLIRKDMDVDMLWIRCNVSFKDEWLGLKVLEATGDIKLRFF